MYLPFLPSHYHTRNLYGTSTLSTCALLKQKQLLSFVSTIPLAMVYLSCLSSLLARARCRTQRLSHRFLVQGDVWSRAPAVAEAGCWHCCYGFGQCLYLHCI